MPNPSPLPKLREIPSPWPVFWFGVLTPVLSLFVYFLGRYIHWGLALFIALNVPRLVLRAYLHQWQECVQVEQYLAHASERSSQ